MKGFIVAILFAGIALFLVALLWPDHSPSVGTPRQRRQTAAASVKAQEIPMIRERVSVPAALRPTTPAMSRESTSVNSAEYRMELPPTLAEKWNNATPEQDSSSSADTSLTPDEELTIKQTGTDDTSLRNSDFPRTYISKIHVDLASPNHWVTLTWAGPNARLQPTTRYHSSPGRGLGNNNCDDPVESCRVDSNCTPKGTRQVQAFSNSMRTSPACRYVTWFDTQRGVALHYYPDVPNYPASHGCVRLGPYAAQLIHNNSKIGETEVVVEGKWTGR